MAHNDEEGIQKSLKEHLEQNSLRKAGQENDILRETLQQWAKNEPSHLGSGPIQSVLTSDLEEMIAITLEQCSKMGWLCGDEEVKQVIV